MALVARSSGWARWIGLRLLAGLTVVVVVSMVVFAATQALPSDPARSILGPQATPETLATLRHQLGLDRSLVAQYLSWLGDLVRGDLGRSLDSDQPVATLLGGRLASSLTLIALSALVAIPLAIGGGVLLAVRRGRRGERAALLGLIGILATPGFVLGTALVLLFSTSVLQLLPATSILDPSRPAIAQPAALVLPVLTLAIGTAAYLTRLVRVSMIEALESDHVAAARLRGVPEWRVVWRHALPGALVPAIQGLALSLSVLVGGTLVIEVTFAFPGLGTLLDSAVEHRDLPLLQAEVVAIAAGVVLINLLADLATVVLTPRLRTGIATA